jgi:hypothetical protein
MAGTWSWAGRRDGGKGRGGRWERFRYPPGGDGRVSVAVN